MRAGVPEAGWAIASLEAHAARLADSSVVVPLNPAAPPG
ncbi:hypothetical protein AX27061_3074 [Achromobacter xylosoxidans NBRC 15126 = ATCC 27061]|nr:hypothetical protein AX27061_3074 [Achromobacter xylosoxidans NBRC 15126 = ATCC 27061]